MRNDTILKATWVVNKEGINELYFDYYDKESNLVGNVIVNEDGLVGWSILNLLYEPNITFALQYILGCEPEKTLEYKTQDEDIERWYRARMLVKNRNLILNFKDSDYLENEFDSGFTR